MATEVRLPADAPVWEPDYKIGPKEYLKAEEEYLESLKRYVKARWTSPLSGELVRWPMADGYALYMVISERPFQLAHVNVGDAWQAHAETIRGFRVADARRMVAADKSLRAMFDKPQEFYDTVSVGDIVHYSNSFAAFVRCEVVEFDPKTMVANTSGEVKAGEKVLREIALVGEIGRRQQANGKWVHGWATYDISRRMPDGTVSYSYHSEGVKDGRIFKPSASSLWEYPEFHQRAACLEAGIDPTTMEPIDLEPPPMTAEQKRIVPLAKAVNHIKGVLNEQLPWDNEKAMRGVLVAISEIAEKGIKA